MATSCMSRMPMGLATWHLDSQLRALNVQRYNSLVTPMSYLVAVTKRSTRELNPFSPSRSAILGRRDGGASAVVEIMTSARSRHLKNLINHGCSRFDLIQLNLPKHLANMRVTTTQHMVGDNCCFEPLSLPAGVILDDHASLYLLQFGRYMQL